VADLKEDISQPTLTRVQNVIRIMSACLIPEHNFNPVKHAEDAAKSAEDEGFLYYFIFYLYASYIDYFFFFSSSFLLFR
jgi:hypothetical protein